MARKTRKNQYPAYALKSDDGDEELKKPNPKPMPLKAMMAQMKDQLKPGSNYLLFTRNPL